jgi:hypothetical protein
MSRLYLRHDGNSVDAMLVRYMASDTQVLCILFFILTPPMKMEQAECYQTSAYKIQTPGNHPKEKIQHSEQDESLKSRRISF